MNTVRLEYSDFGSGSPVVLLHGFPLDRTIWQGQHGLADRYRVITPDLRGHGQSPAPEGAYTMEELAGDVLALLDRLKIERAVLMGHSMGGYVALAAWALAPARFSALGLIASHAGADTEEGRQNRRALAAKVGKVGATAADEAMSRKLFAPAVAENDSRLQRVRELILKTNIHGIQGALEGMALRPDRTLLLPAISVPFLMLAGAVDQVIPPEKTKGVAAAVPNSRLVIIPDAGHMPMIEQPLATTTAIREFLDKI